MNNDIIFYLARHGQTVWNTEHRIQGQLDSPLTPEGEQQAKQLGIDCRSLNINKVLSSSLGRAKQTALICAKQLQLEVQTVNGFEERHFGYWQGKLTSEVKGHPDYQEITSQITDCKPESGESSKQVLARFKERLMETLEAAKGERLLIIVHGEILRCFMGSLQKNSVSSTGYDYQNGKFISVRYDLNTRQFFQ